MGREATRREVSYRTAGLEVFGMEMLDSGGNISLSVASAIEVAVATAQRAFIRGIRDDLLERAEMLDDEENDLYEDGPAALLWYAWSLDEQLPYEQRLETSE